MNVEELTVDEMAEVSGGFMDIMNMKVKCPVNGCGFECDRFGELNRHMREQHSGRQKL